MADPGGGNYVDLVAMARAAAAAPAAATFKVNGIAYTCQGAVIKLRGLQRSSNKDSWSHVDVSTEGQGDSEVPKLKCNHCGSFLAVSNPAQSLKTHLTERACSGMRRANAAQAAAEVAAAAPAAASAAAEGGSSNSLLNTTTSANSGGGSTKRKMGRGISIMCASTTQQEAFEKSLARITYHCYRSDAQRVVGREQRALPSHLHRRHQAVTVSRH